MHSSNDSSDSANTDNASPKRSKSRRGRGRRKSPGHGGLALIIESERLGICRLPAKNRIPIWVHRSSFYTVSRSRDELSIVCEERLVPKSVRCEVGWRAIRVKEPLDPSLVGVLASMANPLTKAGVSIFSISTYDTDYLLVRQKKLNRARQVLEEAGHRFLEPEDLESADSESQGVEPQGDEPQANEVETRADGEPQTDDVPSSTEAETPSEADDTPPRRRRRRRGQRSGETSRAAESSTSASEAPAQDGAAQDSPSPAAPQQDHVADEADEERPKRRRRRRRRRSPGAETADSESDAATSASPAEPLETESSQAQLAESTASDETSPQSPDTAALGDIPSSGETGTTPEAEASAEPVSATSTESGVGTDDAASEDDPSESMLAQSTRRRTLRSSERLKRLSQALRQFGASLTSDPRFSGSSNATAESETDEATETTASSEPVSGPSEAAEPETSEVAETEGSPSQAAEPQASVPRASASRTSASRTEASPADKRSAEGDELDLDWESELVAKEGAATQEPTAEVAASPAPETAEAVQASKMAAFEGESLSLAANDDEGDDEVDAAGLYTGAIPQGDVEVTDQSFATLGLSDPVLEAVRQMGFEHPTPIQAAVVPEALEGVDIIGLAETGSGKTAAFVLPLAERLYHGKGIRGLIICPTREIALQTKAFIDAFGRDHKLRAVAVIGGVKMGPQIDRLRSRPDIVVATPGRLADHLRRGNVDLGRLEELVIDEADHMLDLGFLPQIREILEQVPKERRSMMFSATMLPEIERLAQQFMNEPLTIDIRPVNRVAEGIEHRLYLVHDADLKTCLLRLLDEVQGSTLIFARRKLHTEWLARQLQQAGWPADRIHSDRTQAQRVRALRGFREGKFRILVATDVAARGIDVPRIQHVINYGLPEGVADYVHRAGRTARGNSVGVVSSIGTWQDKPMVREIESVLGTEIPRCELEGIEPYVERRPRRKTVRRRRLL